MTYNGLPKPQLREKISQMYEDLLSGKDVETRARFWDEFFVLKPKIAYLKKVLEAISDADLKQKKVICLKFTARVVERLEVERTDTESTSKLCSFHALVNLGVLLEELTIRHATIDASDVLFGSSDAMHNARGKAFFESMRKVINDGDDILMRMVTKMLLKIVSITDDVNANPLLPYLMYYSFFDEFMRIIADPWKRKVVGYEIVTLLGILPHFTTAEPEGNPYMQLSVMDPSIELMGIAAVIGAAFRNSTKGFFQTVVALQKNKTWMSWLTKTVTRSLPPKLDIDLEDSMLLSLCTGLKIGRNFVHAFTHAQSEILVEPTNPVASLDAEKSISSTSEPAVVTPKNNRVNEPSNLFVEFLQYASIVMQHIGQEKPSLHAQMCLVILCTITEDHYTTQFMHDFSINYRVQFFRAGSRYHPCQILKSAKPEPLACAVLNLISEFLTGHMMLNFPHDLYFRCLLIIYRLMDYQKRTRFRLPYQWKTLWDSLLTLLKFLETNESQLMEQMANFFLLCTQVVNILNIFLIGGDAILSQVGSYDDLCYEIIRNSTMINSAYAMGLRYSAVQSASTQAAAKKFLSAMTNLRAVMTHFIPKIEAFSAEYHKTTMERDEILGVIRSNYDNLSLKLVDMTDCFEKHANGAKDKRVIEQFLKSVLCDLRTSHLFSQDDCTPTYTEPANAL